MNLIELSRCIYVVIDPAAEPDRSDHFLRCETAKKGYFQHISAEIFTTALNHGVSRHQYLALIIIMLSA